MTLPINEPMTLKAAALRAAEQFSENHQPLRLLMRNTLAAIIETEVGKVWPPRSVPRPREEWDYEDGDVLWWKIPVEEPPYVGTPDSSDWPGYHTHWTPFSVPESQGNGK